MRKLTHLWLIAMAGLVPALSHGQVTFTNLNSYSQDFTTLGTANATFTNNSSITGWYITGTTLQADEGQALTAACYNYGQSNAANGNINDRALGTVSETGADKYFGVRIKNSTGTTINSFGIAFTGEEWHAYTSNQPLTFDYQVSASGTITSLTTGSWTNYAPLNFVPPFLFPSPAGADGNAGIFRSVKSITLDVAVPDGGEIFLRWGKTGTNSCGLAVDDVTITPSFSPATFTSLALTAIAPASPNVGSLFNVTVQARDQFNNPFNVPGGTTAALSVGAGTGTLAGTTTGAFSTGTSSLILNGVSYSVAESGVVLTASIPAGGITPGNSSSFVVQALPSQLALVGAPAVGYAGTAFPTFTVEARRPNNTVDNTYTGTITLTQASGPGNITGTTSVAAVNGVATFAGIAPSAQGVITFSADATGLTTATTGNIPIYRTTLATDYFRSAVTSGNYGSAGSWESSASGSGPWAPSSAVPTNSASGITIRNGHTITIAAAATGKFIVIQNGGTLNHLTSSFQIADGAGDDMIVEAGGTFQESGDATIPTFSPTTATISFQKGGRFYISASAGKNGQASFIISSYQSANYIYGDSSILEYSAATNLTLAGITIFPNAGSAVPIFRCSQSAVTFTTGSGLGSTINGALYLGAGNTTTISGTGIKTIRNGIFGPGTLVVSGAAGLFITGKPAYLGGGTLALNNTAGLLTMSSDSVVLLSDKAITSASNPGPGIKLTGKLNTNGFAITGGNNNTFTIDANSTLYVTAAGGPAGNITGTFSRVYTNPNIVYNGTTAQVTGTELTTINSLTIDNPSGVTLSSNATIQINTALSLKNGKITTTGAGISNAQLQMLAGSSVTASSDASFVNGQLIKVGNTPFTFPVGKGSSLRPISIGAPGNLSDVFTAEYFNSAYTNRIVNPTNTEVMTSVSAVEYWDLGTSSSSRPNVTLTINAASGISSGNISNLRVAHYAANNIPPSWDNLGLLASNGTITTGEITGSTAGLVSFSPFTIGSVSPIVPLPVKVSSFNLEKQSGKAVLSWTLGTTDGDETIRLEHSTDGKTFTTIHTQNAGKVTSVQESYTDAAPASGANQYRLAITSGNGVVSYSRILTAVFGKDGIANIYPNPANDFVQVSWANAATPSTVEIRNAFGQMVWARTVTGTDHLEVAAFPMALILFAGNRTVK